MRIKQIFISIAIALISSASAHAQTTKDIGLICLNPHIPETEALGQKATSMLTSKLQQIATANGMSGAGLTIASSSLLTFKSSRVARHRLFLRKMR